MALPKNVDLTNKKVTIKKSVAPIYSIAVVWVLYALIFPLYRWYHFLIAAGISFIVFYLLRLMTTKTYVEDMPQEEVPLTEYEKMLAAGELYVEALRKLSLQIIDYNQEVAEQTTTLKNTFQKILDHIKQHPKDAPHVRRCVDYYLPSAVKFLRSYHDIHTKNVKGQNSDSIIRDVEGVLKTLITAIEHLADKLYADDQMDISSDIKVLEHLFDQDGLIDKTKQ